MARKPKPGGVSPCPVQPGAMNLIKSSTHGTFGTKENVRAWKPGPVMAGGLVIAFKLPGAFLFLRRLLWILILGDEETTILSKGIVLKG